MDRLAALVSPGRSLERAQTRAGLVEALGYELVLDNHIFNRDGLSTVVAYGSSTSSIDLGTGVYPMLHMSPVALGQLAASIDELVGGRLVLGIGTSHRPTIEDVHGLEFPDSPLTAMRDAVTILRAMFREGEVRHDGEVFSAGFSFRGFTPRPDIPIYLAALGPKMLQLAGELADGVVLWLCNPDYIENSVVPNLRTGAERAGRDPGAIEIVPAITCSVTDDPDDARSRFKRQLVPYLSLPFYRSMLEDSGFGDDLERFDEGMTEGDVDRALQGVSDGLIDSLSGIGTIEDVQAAIERYREAGATLPGVGPLGGEDGAIERTFAAAAGREVDA
ncbi:MAG: LLM class flavin-dependent oxidoreductase [Nitriliruptorales bacterium]|nr:LLM class flavin-dependent oxidoreductase [Nitriliruptorales bacterium]